MTYRFDPNASFIAVETLLVGPSLICQTIFALDTGATQTGIDEGLLKQLGFDPSMAVNQFSIATVRGLIPCSEYRLSLFSALGVEKTDFEAASLDFRTMSFDGVLGKDFFRDRVLTIDFRNGTIDLQ